MPRIRDITIFIGGIMLLLGVTAIVLVVTILFELGRVIKNLPISFTAVGTEIMNTKIISLSVTIFSAFFLAFLLIALIGPEQTKKDELASTVPAPQKLQQTSSGRIAGVPEGPTVVNITVLDNTSNITVLDNTSNKTR